MKKHRFLFINTFLFSFIIYQAREDKTELNLTGIVKKQAQKAKGSRVRKHHNAICVWDVTTRKVLLVTPSSKLSPRGWVSTCKLDLE